MDRLDLDAVGFGREDVSATSNGPELYDEDQRKAKLENNALESRTKLTVDIAQKIFKYMLVVTVLIFFFISIYFFAQWYENAGRVGSEEIDIIPSSVMIALISSMFATAVGLVGIMVKGLFHGHIGNAERRK